MTVDVASLKFEFRSEDAKAAEVLMDRLIKKAERLAAAANAASRLKRTHHQRPTGPDPA